METRNLVNEESLIRSLLKKGCKFNDNEIDITIPYDNQKLGNKSWGKLDYFVKNKICNVVRYIKSEITKKYIPVHYRPRFDK